MKKLLKFMLVAVLISTAAVSCKTDDPTPDPTPGIKPYPYKKETIAKTGEGVSLKVSNISETNFTITTIMGADIPAYRFDILPLAKFYNEWYESGKDSETKMSLEEFIYKRLIDNQGNSGFTFAKPIDVTWGGSIYNAAAIIPGVDYIVLACGSLNPNGTGYGEITTLKVSLDEVVADGNPIANIEPLEDFQGLGFNFTMNEDCYGFYYLAAGKDEFTEYIEFVTALGEDSETMLRDVTCTFLKEPYKIPTTYSKDYGFNAKPGITMTALTVGLDANGRLSKTVSRADATIQDPPQLDAAKYTVDILNTSALTVTTKWWGDWNVTRAIYHRLGSQPTIASLLKTYSATQLAQLLAYEGWGHNAANKEVQIYTDLAPTTEHILVTTARNKALDLTPLKFDTITTKKLIKNEKDQSLAQVSVEVLDKQKTSVKLKYNITDETTVFFERILEKGSKDPTTGTSLDPSNEDFVVDWLTGVWGNLTAGDGPREWTWTGLEPDKEYTAYIVAEDINGRIGHLYTVDFKTNDNEGGDKPEMELTYYVDKNYDGTIRWNVAFKPNNDVRFHRSAMADDTIEGFKEATSDAERQEIWINYLMNGENAAESMNGTNMQRIVTKYSTWTAISLPSGKKIEGSESYVQGPLAVLAFEPSMLNQVQSSMLSVKPFQAATTAEQPINNGEKTIRFAH